MAINVVYFNQARLVASYLLLCHSVSASLDITVKPEFRCQLHRDDPVFLRLAPDTDAHVEAWRSAGDVVGSSPGGSRQWTARGLLG